MSSVAKNLLHLALTVSVNSWSESIIPISELSFGNIAVLNNSSQSYLRIDQNGQVDRQGIASFTPPVRAEYLLQGFPANTNLNITLAITKPTTGSDQRSQEQFTVTQLYYENLIRTSNNGSATLFVGGKLETSGSGVNGYSDSNYNARFSISIN